ncbi:MAG: amino acid permease [Gammaproteobacteria bacterium]
MSRQIGFWSVFALVIGSQVGSGVFMLPASLAPFGIYSLAGWIVSAIGAVALATVFASLCARFPRTGGPHAYAEVAFGPSVAFFTGWTYWVISWVSSAAVIVASIGYLTPLIGSHSAGVTVGLEILLLLSITGINLKGVSTAGRMEFVLTLMKVIPLLVIPIAALFYFDASHLIVASEFQSLTVSEITAKAALLTLWGFIGLECATTPAGSVENPTKTIPRAIIAGTLCVSVLYFINSLGIMGLFPSTELMNAKAPYVDAAQKLFGGRWHLIVSAMASIVCIGTLNAWVLSSGQIALGLSQDGYLPKFFGIRNQSDAPAYSLMISAIGIIPLLILTANESLSRQITLIIDFSVTAFLYVYLLCAIGYLKIVVKQQTFLSLHSGLSIIAILFSGWVLYETSVQTLLIAALFTISGVPLFLKYKRYF